MWVCVGAGRSTFDFDVMIPALEEKVYEVTAGSSIKVNLNGDGPFDVYVLDQENYQRYKKGNTKEVYPIVACQSQKSCRESAKVEGASTTIANDKARPPLKVVLVNPHEVTVVIQGT